MMLGRVRPRYVINIVDDRNSSATLPPAPRDARDINKTRVVPDTAAGTRLLCRLLVIPLDTIKIISIMYNGI